MATKKQPAGSKPAGSTDIFGDGDAGAGNPGGETPAGTVTLASGAQVPDPLNLAGGEPPRYPDTGTGALFGDGQDGGPATGETTATGSEGTHAGPVAGPGTLAQGAFVLAGQPAGLAAVLALLDRYFTGVAIYEHGVVEGNGDDKSKTIADVVRAALAGSPGEVVGDTDARSYSLTTSDVRIIRAALAARVEYYAKRAEKKADDPEESEMFAGMSERIAAVSGKLQG